MSIVHVHLGGFGPGAAVRSIHLGNIQRYRRRIDLQALLERMSFHDCTIYWDDNAVTPANTYHAGWCWIEFPDTTTANRARVSLNGFEFYGRKLLTGHCRIKKVSGRHSDWRAFDPKHVAQSIHLGNIRHTVPQEDVQALLTSVGLEDCIFYWNGTKLQAGQCHRGWCWIKFADASTAARAMTCLEGMPFQGRILFTRDCAEVAKAWDWAGAASRPPSHTLARHIAPRAPIIPVHSTKLPGSEAWAGAGASPSTRPDSTQPALSALPTQTPAVELLISTRATYVSRGTQTDGGNPSCSCGQQDQDHMGGKEDRDQEDSDEDLMTFDSPDRPETNLSHDWWL